MEQAFDRISFVCQHCGAQGIILSVAVNLTYLALEGFCHVCRIGIRTMQDLLRIDTFLQGDGPAPRAEPGEHVGYTISDQDRPARQRLRGST